MLSIDAILEKYANVNYETTPIKVQVEKLKEVSKKPIHSTKMIQSISNQKFKRKKQNKTIKHNTKSRNIKCNDKRRRHSNKQSSRNQNKTIYIPNRMKIPKIIPVKIRDENKTRERETQLDHLINQIDNKTIRRKLEQNGTISKYSTAPAGILRDLYKCTTISNLRITRKNV